MPEKTWVATLKIGEVSGGHYAEVVGELCDTDIEALSGLCNKMLKKGIINSFTISEAIGNGSPLSIKLGHIIHDAFLLRYQEFR